MSDYEVEGSLMYRIGEQCIKWCRKTYGRRSHRALPKLMLTAKRKKYAEYNYYTNSIEVDIKKHLVKKKGSYIGLDVEQYVDSVIHEYQHYLQNWRLMKNIGFTKKGDYIGDNLYEQLAISVAERDTLTCINYLKNKLNLTLDERSRLNLHQ